MLEDAPVFRDFEEVTMSGDQKGLRCWRWAEYCALWLGADRKDSEFLVQWPITYINDFICGLIWHSLSENVAPRSAVADAECRL
jgi:hypothetical protein